jgi:protein gp37
MNRTKIQWCHGTANPVMGCDGCELWPSAGLVSAGIEKELQSIGLRLSRAALKATLNGHSTSAIYQNREAIALKLVGSDKRQTGRVVDVVRRHAKCYAGLLGTFRAGHKGYAGQFEQPKCYPGRMAKAAKWGFPTEKEIVHKPWLDGCPRLIFISDMGDALSAEISFEYLRREIIEQVTSDSGRRHIWLWLTKRPGRMAQFGEWLINQGGRWPENLMAMTTVTAQSKAYRVDQLRGVPSKLRGLSLEPLFEPVHLNLTDIDWVIVGGGSDVLAEPFEIDWALGVREQCKKAGVAFFLKQLGKRPVFQNRPLPLLDKHGGDWAEWPKEWRIRGVPTAFREYRKTCR